MSEYKSQAQIYCNSLATAANSLTNLAYHPDPKDDLESIIVTLSNLERALDHSRVFVDSEQRKEVNVKLDNLRTHISILVEKADKEKLKKLLDSYGNQLKIRFV